MTRNQLPATASPGRQSLTIIPAAHGHAFRVEKGKRFRVIDLYGEQVVDFAAWVADTDLVVKLSMSYTRYHLTGVTPAVGECLWTNRDEPILRITADTVKVHDMTFMSCFPELYEKRGFTGHRSCASNIAEAMAPYGMRSHLEVTDPFNIFQNTPNYSLKRLGSSKAGDYIEFEALQDTICAVSCCPFDLDGFNGGVVTDIAVMTDIVSPPAAT
ncbi:Ubiquitin-activating enzyme E1-like [Sphaceloma murrayae]|uniref:Ubiquitin-activating enzyme E1-like n=1 Tax=Sphaceloma murrayae TaxID=2082308 RepID=A0A2K1QNK8_9PEZI|nr:Ubiquitin-activating enzyme E1-like [Sphaceloma murrayae]